MFDRALGAAFRVEPFQLQARLYEKLVTKARPAAGNKALAEALLDLAGRSATAERFEPAERLLKLAARTAGKARDGQLVRRIKARGEELAEARHESDSAERARGKLAAAPEDAEAQLALGRYLCFARADWPAGLPHLAKGSDAALKSLAQESLAAPAGQATALADVGDRWCEAAQRAKGRDKANFGSAARHWYSAAQRQGLSGLTKTKVERRLDELGGPEGTQSATATTMSALRGRAAMGHAAPPASAGFDQRSVALWVLSQAGTVKLLNGEQISAAIKSSDALPPGELVVSEIELKDNKLLTNDDLARLRGLQQLRLLKLGHTNITDAGLVHLQALANLDFLDLNSTRVTDAGLEPLKVLPKLYTLYLLHTAITDQGLAILADFPTLGSLHLAKSKISPDDAPQRLQRLKLYSLEVSGMTDAGAARLYLLPDLMWLGLAGSNLTDAGLAHVVQLQKLIMLDLWDNKRITDAGLELLTRLPKLRDLKVPGTSVTEAGLARFRAARPDVKIVH